nr:unnamed protein product [Callosobruchus chinensis]
MAVLFTMGKYLFSRRRRRILFAQVCFKKSAGRQLKLRNTSSSIVLPCAEEEARIWKLSRRREDRCRRYLKMNLRLGPCHTEAISKSRLASARHVDYTKSTIVDQIPAELINNLDELTKSLLLSHNGNLQAQVQYKSECLSKSFTVIVAVPDVFASVQPVLFIVSVLGHGLRVPLVPLLLRLRIPLLRLRVPLLGLRVPLLRLCAPWGGLLGVSGDGGVGAVREVRARLRAHTGWELK